MIFEDSNSRRRFLDGLENEMRKGRFAHAEMAADRKFRRVAHLDPELDRLVQHTGVDDLRITGWHRLRESIEQVEEFAGPITAISIDLSWPGHFARAIAGGVPELDYDPQGGLTPVLETNYFTNRDGIDFSTANREEVLRCYRGRSSVLQGEFEDISDLIGIDGMDGLYGAVQRAHARSKVEPAFEDVHALGAAIAAILVHAAVERKIVCEGLPKPMTVFVGSNEDFPFFNAPVMSGDETSVFIGKYAARERAEAKQREEQAAARAAEEKIEFDPVRGFAEMADATREIGKLFGSAADDLKPLLKNKAAMQAVGAIGIALLGSAFRKRR